jgi:hypothetical protein
MGVLLVRESKIGLGAFTIAPLERGDLVVDWSDHPLFQDPPRVPSTWRFTEIAPGILTGPLGPEEHPDAYINHSCEPNAEVRFEGRRVRLLALLSIPAGCEVTFDYATLYPYSWMMKCRCGSARCRGVITGSRGSR